MKKMEFSNNTFYEMKDFTHWFSRPIASMYVGLHTLVFLWHWINIDSILVDV